MAPNKDLNQRNSTILMNSLALDPLDTLVQTKEDLLVRAGHSFASYAGRKKIRYLNVPCAFDIETSSWYNVENDKKACMYIWQFGINGYVITGRTWETFKETLAYVRESLSISTENRLVIYVHNLAFEFQWIRMHFQWLEDETFALDVRKVNRCCTTDGIEFRCSLQLAGVSLETVGDNLVKYRTKKLVGDLDYSLIRTYKTRLSPDELRYCINDVRVVMAYIQECMERDGNITRIQRTKTGYVRKKLRDACFFGSDANHKKHMWVYAKYMKLMSKLVLTPEEYLIAREAFMGGYTHASAFYSGRTMEKALSKDITSSYPTVMIADLYPMSKGKKIRPRSMKAFYDFLTQYCCIFTVKFYGLGLQEKAPDSYLSKSHCNGKGIIENNGRVSYADELETTITNVDWFIIENVYEWDRIQIGDFWIYRAGHLPKPIILTLLDLYEKKTTLKGVEGKEVEYQSAKADINSAYGCMVMDVIRPEIGYDPITGNWSEEDGDLKELIRKENANKKRFSTYLWGLFIPAWARWRIWQAILELGDDYLYCDTDSVKYIHPEAHEEWFEQYNKDVTRQLEETLEEYEIPLERLRPKTVKGVEKPLGVFDDDGHYDRFKALRAKCYMVEKEGKVSITVSGVNKREAVPWMLEQKKDPFKLFADGLHIPKEHTGKLTHTYIDFPYEDTVTDCQGNTVRIKELSGIHMEPCSYDLSITDEYIEYISDLRGEYYVEED